MAHLALKKTYRAQLSKLVNSANEFLSSGNASVEDLTIQLARVKETRGSLVKINEKVLPTIEDEEQLTSECEKVVEYEDLAVSCIARLELAITKLTKNQLNERVDQNELPQTPAAQHFHNCEKRIKNSVRLPKLDLLQFGGDLQAWPAFWEQFSKNIHENDELDNCAKFSYLKSLVFGDAAITIKGLTSSEMSYNNAIEMLKEEYGNQERIVDKYTQQLLSLTPVKSKNDALSLRKLYNTAATTTRSLQVLGMSADHYGLMVKSMVLRSLPYSMRIEFNKYIRNKKVYEENSDGMSGTTGHHGTANSDIPFETQITELLNFIKLELESVQQAQAADSVNDKRANIAKYTNKKENPCTAAGLLTSVKESCVFCNSKNHNSLSCDGPLNIVQKKNILKQNYRCFRCTKGNHTSRNCKTKVRCEKCNGKHATTMCDPEYRRKYENNKTLSFTENTNEQSTYLLANSRLCNVYLQTACAFIQTDRAVPSVLIRLVIDGGSQRTFIRKSVSRQLNLPITGKHNISIVPFGSNVKSPPKLCRVVSVKLKSQHTEEIIEINAIEVPEICFDSLKMPSLSEDPVIQDFSLNYQLADSVPSGCKSLSDITMLIGADNYWRLVTGEQRRITNNLYAVNSKLGWTLHGTNDEFCYSLNVNVVSVFYTQVINNEYDLKNFWNLETIGIKEDPSMLQKFTLKFMEENVKFTNGRYEVSLPWNNVNEIDSNYNGALVRVKTLTSKLIKSSKLQEYDQAMREYLKNDCAEPVPVVSNDERKTYYMPHRAVYREDKETTKLRIVFDASAHAPGLPSLNESLLAGENLVPQLLRILLNFRIGRVALIADIEKAFLQIVLAENERNSHCFLWYEKPIENVLNLPRLIKFRMKRVTFGVTCSPFLLAVVLRKHLMETSKLKEYNDVCNILLQSFYVDDLVVAIDNADLARTIVEQSKRIMSLANMNLRKWDTNDLSLKMDTMDPNDNRTINKKVLGVQWCRVTDELNIDLNQIISQSNKIIATKRTVLQMVAKVYDPLGFLGPFVIKAKIMVQEIWKLKLDWDMILPTELANEWLNWFYEFPILKDFSVQRSVVNDFNSSLELHIFADASPRAYGAAAYLRTASKNCIQCSLLMSKNRVAPINEKDKKNLTLPKLELTAALCASRLQTYILNNLKITPHKIYLWTDSKIALYWIRGNANKWKPYVSNRVKEIQDITKGTWKHCSSNENPADLLTRGITAKKLIESELWKHGPEWLKNDSENWPKEEKEEVDVSAFLVKATEQPLKQESPIFPLERYSNYDKILRITAYVMRYVTNLKKKKSKECRNVERLNVNDLESARNYWIRITQNEAFRNEIVDLVNKGVIDKTSTILTLNPFIDPYGLLRLGGRLQEADMPFETKHPIILPNKCMLTEKIIWKAHSEMAHGGVNATMTWIREKFWIIKARQRIKSVIGKCIKCQRFKKKPSNKIFAPLPRNRVTMANPFKIIGIDFAGPLYIKDVKEDRTKVYVMLITCAVIRAVHLELITDLSSESCIRGLRRFFARRGIPNVVYSDNAKTFKRTSLEMDRLTEILARDEVQEMVLNKGIQWNFIIERAAWWGGFWERLVRSIKNALKVSIGRSTLSYDELNTVLIEVEMTINNRPLTYIDSDPDNLFILTPSHFLTGQSNSGIYIDFDPAEVKCDDIIKKWKLRESVVRKFWKRWSTDYLQQLRSAHNVNQANGRQWKIGDIALLHDQNLPRLLWKLVKVTEIYKGRDGRVRSCEVRISNGTKLRRPVQLLFPLEIQPAAGEDVEKL